MAGEPFLGAALRVLRVGLRRWPWRATRRALALAWVPIRRWLLTRGHDRMADIDLDAHLERMYRAPLGLDVADLATPRCHECNRAEHMPHCLWCRASTAAVVERARVAEPERGL